MRLVFAGTSGFAVPILEAVRATGHEIAAVLTQPDRPAGRGLKLHASAVKQAALRLGLQVLQPERVNTGAAREALRVLAPALILTAAYGQWVGGKLLALPPLGCYNVHGSLLPRHRGAAPIQRALIEGDRETGVTIFRMAPQMDAGPVLLDAALAITPDETAAELEARLARLGAETAVRALALLAAGPPRLAEQDERLATCAPMLTKADGELDWTAAAATIHNRVRGVTPWPGAFSRLHRAGETAPLRLGILRTQAIAAPAPDGPAAPAPGAVLAVEPEGIRVAAGDGGAVRLLEVKPESRGAMPAAVFARGYRISSADRFERDPK
ncbi:MAG: methionyl-tRNA formyltransferase [Planctomycetes bacterium]|nr:methionyl-tRNA formyltransferase [Planctomycetota bacterium]